MQEDKMIREYSAHVCSIANETFSLREKISKKRLAREVLYHFPKDLTTK